MFNEGIHQFIRQMKGSRVKAGEAIGCTADMIGKMLRGDEAVPLQRALLIEELSDGAITVDCLIKRSHPALAKALRKSRHRHHKQAIQIKQPCFLVNMPVMAINVKRFTFCNRDYLTGSIKNKATLLVDEMAELLYGLNTLAVAKKAGQSSIIVWSVSLTSLLHESNCTLETINLRLSQRLAVGLALESTLGNRQGLRTDITTNKKHKNSIELRLNWDEVSGRSDVFIAQLCGIGSKNTYCRLKQVFLHGIPALREAVDKKHISISRAAQMARLPSDQQAAALTDFLQQKNKEKKT